MAQQEQISNAILDRWAALSSDRKKATLANLDVGDRQALYSAIQARWGSTSPTSWRQARDPYSGQPYGPRMPEQMAIDMENRDRLAGRAGTAENVESIPGMQPVGSATSAVGLAEGAPRLLQLLRSGDWPAIRAMLARTVRHTAMGAGGGATVGRIVGGPEGAAAGAKMGGLGGLVHGLLTPDPTIEEQAMQGARLSFEKARALRSLEVEAGMRSPMEDDLAEQLRKDILAPPKKSGVPQDIRSPRAITPTFVPEGVPGAAPGTPPRSKTIGELAQEINLLKESQTPQEALAEAVKEGRAAKLPTRIKIPTQEPDVPPMSKLSEGPTALQHQVARENVLNDIRNATINRPGWMSKLPDRVKFAKLTPETQLGMIKDAIESDPVAKAAIREGARVGSAGDLASWKREDLWAQYMKEYVAHPGEKTPFMQAIENELARHGRVAATESQVRP